MSSSDQKVALQRQRVSPDDLREIKQIATAVLTAIDTRVVQSVEEFHGTIFIRGKDNIMSNPGPGLSSYQVETDDWYLQVAVRVPHGPGTNSGLAPTTSHRQGVIVRTVGVIKAQLVRLIGDPVRPVMGHHSTHPVPHRINPHLLPYKDYGGASKDSRDVALAIIAAANAGEINAAETFSGMILTQSKINNLPFPGSSLNPGQTKDDDWYLYVSVRVPYTTEINEYTTHIANLKRGVLKRNIEFFTRKIAEEPEVPDYHPSAYLREHFRGYLDQNSQALADIKHPEI